MHETAGEGQDAVHPMKPWGHAQEPPWQVVPPVQVKAGPQPPQLVALGVLFVISSTHAPPQGVKPGAHGQVFVPGPVLLQTCSAVHPPLFVAHESTAMQVNPEPE